MTVFEHVPHLSKAKPPPKKKVSAVKAESVDEPCSNDTSELDLISTLKLRRPPPKPPPNPELEWVPLVEDADGDPDGGLAHADLRRLDGKRKSLLSLARSTSAIDTLTTLSTLPRTVLPKLLGKPMIWVFILYAASALACAAFALACAASALACAQPAPPAVPTQANEPCIRPRQHVCTRRGPRAV